jgi:hypothetical protein
MSKLNLILIAAIASLAAACYVLSGRLAKEKAEKEIYRGNTVALMSDLKHYQTRDSLNAVSVDHLLLTIDEYKKYRQEDMKLIADLKVDRNRLQQITTVQTQTTYELSGIVRDSVVSGNRFTEDFQRANTAFDGLYTDTLKCISIHEKWFDLNGCIDAKSKFAGRFESRDSLVYVEHVVPKRFWFIRWGVKERRQEIVSKNPHTRITGAEFVTIRK